MPDQHRDDSPTAFSLARREIVIGGAFLVGGLATGLMPTQAATAAWSEEVSARFMEISLLLIPHRLNQEVGKRIGAAMGALNSQLSDQVTELLAIARNKNAKVVEDFFPDVPEGPLKETALSIISAVWRFSLVLIQILASWKLSITFARNASRMESGLWTGVCPDELGSK